MCVISFQEKYTVENLVGVIFQKIKGLFIISVNPMGDQCIFNEV